MQVFFVCESLQFMNFLREEFLTDIDFCNVGIIQGLILNFNLCLLTFLNGA